MIILESNNGRERVPILKSHLYLYITDYKEKFFLKEIKIGPAQRTWCWMSFKTNKFVDISDINNHYCSFDNAINRTVNDAYCTVYEFEDSDDMVKNWEEIKYIDSITTIYKSEDNKE